MIQLLTHLMEFNNENLLIEMAQGDEENGEQKEGTESAQKSEQEAMAFIEKNRDLFEHYGRGKVKFKPAPAGVDTFAFDLETDTIYIHPRFYQELGFSEEKTSFATLHEIEHFLEKIAMLSEKGGSKAFEKYLRQIKESKAYGVMDNVVADVRENRTVVAKTNKAWRDIEVDCYKQDLFKETDFMEEPRHIQFAYALLRENRVPDEPCAVAPEVREKLDALKAMKDEDDESLFDLFTNPDVPMSLRLKYQDEQIWPIVKELLDKDMEDQKQKDKQEKDQQKNQEGKSEEKEQKQEKGEKESEQQGKKGSDKGKSTKPEAGKGKGKPDPNQVFKEAYDRAKKKVPNAVSKENIEKAFKEWKKSHAEDPLESADKEYAEKLGVKKEELQNYRRIVESLNQVRNPETNLSVIAELRELINRIIASRLKLFPAPRYPTEEGEDLVDPAELVTQVKAGNLEPKAWETQEVKEKKGGKFGEVEITLVCDRSGSMQEGSKLTEQQKASVLMMEALKEFAEACDAERVNMEQPLEVRSEIFSFQASNQDRRPLKVMSKELGEKERITITAVLSSAPGQKTTDFVPLEVINENISPDIKQKIEDGELKKIVVVFTDGVSDDPERVRRTLEKLHQQKTVVVGVGITEEGRRALETYAPNARLAKTAEELPLVLADILKEHLSSL
jgi:hypothetical protein